MQRRDVPTGRVVQVRPPAGHPGPEVGADRAEHDHDAARHVLAAVRTDALDHGRRAAVADREAHPRPPDQVQPTARRPVQHGVAGDRLARCRDRQIGLRSDDQPPARQPLADVVVGLTDEREIDRPRRERPERLPRRAAQLEAHRAAELASLDRAGQGGAERAVGGR